MADDIIGTPGDDNLLGTEDSERILAGDGDDNIHGYGGDDELYGEGGNDFLAGGLGDDLIDGGDGRDIANYAEATDPVVVDLAAGTASGADGNDTLLNIEDILGSQYDDLLIGDDNDNMIIGNGGNDDIYGGGGDDNLIGNEGDDFIYGDDGNDQLLGGLGDDYLIGGDGNDTANYYAAAGSVTVDLSTGTATGADGNDTLFNIENILGSDGYGDVLTGDDEANMIDGAGGDDEIHGGGGDDNLIGSAGDDQLFGEDGDDQLLGGPGDDHLDGGDGTDTANYYAATGSVTVDLYAGTATGADGNDTLVNIENILGSVAYGDALLGDDNDNRIEGLGGNDVLRGYGGNDTLDGGDGADFLNGGFGDDYIYGGDGNDRAAYYTANAIFGGVTVSLLLQGQFQNTGAQGYDLLTGIEHVSGTPFADTLIGDAGSNWLWGSAATISPGNVSATNNDYLDGGDGNDLLTVGIGNHTLIGGSGGDTVRFTENGAGDPNITVTLQNQGVAQNTGAGSWILTGIENLSGGQGNDTLIGDSGINLLAGDLGNDTLDGGGGNDLLLGDGYVSVDANGMITHTLDSGSAGGNDVLFGGNGDDALYGGGGSDFLSGGNGNDDLNGGDGNDYLSGSFGNDYINGDAGFDRASYFHSNPALGGVTVSLALQGQWQDTGALGIDRLTGIEAINATPYADTLTGDENDNWLWGSGAYLNGTLISTTNDDVIDGGGGNDLIVAGQGNHILIGGSGTDTVSFTEGTTFTTGFTISLALQGAAQDTGWGNWTISGFENASGNAGHDNLTGDANANVLAGGLGNDVLSGGGGNDTLYGDGEIVADTYPLGLSGPIVTRPDAAAFYGVAGGDDILDGGLGDDLLFGGLGVDTASYASASGSVQVFLYEAGSGESFGAAGHDLLDGIENLTGSEYDDRLFGDDDANVIDGGGGQDEIRGFGGNDTLRGGAGDDIIVGGFGDDIIDGGDGYDRAGYFSQATSGVTVDLTITGPQNTGMGWDTLINIENVSGTRFADTLTGDDNDNWLWGSTGGFGSTDNNDTLSGGGGNDLLTVGYGAHSLSGGSGTDTVRYTENGGVEVNLTLSLAAQGAPQATGAGNWTLTEIENLSGGLLNDTLIGDGGANVLAGDSGDDTLIGGGGNDTLYGDGRIATLTGASGPIATTADVSSIGWTAGNDLLEGGLGDDYLDGGAGIDTASYAHASGSVTVDLDFGAAIGADGNDTLISIENAIGSGFNDFLLGTNTANRLEGGEGHDVLRGYGGDDVLLAGGGDDYLDGGAGDDVIDGGDGYDRVSYFSSPGPVTVDLRLQGQAQNTGYGMDTLIGIEHFGGTVFGDTLIGDGNANFIRGSSNGGAGSADTIDGQGGNDLIEDGAGDHNLQGGAGIDTFTFLGLVGGPGITVSLAQQGAAQNTGVGMMTLNGFENLSGSGNADTLTGDSNANVLAGEGGNDILSGGAGDDQLYGDGYFAIDTHGTLLSGPITLFTDLGAVGGNDILEGGLGNDLLNGGAGNDTASYANASGSVNANLFTGSTGADGNDTYVSIENLIGSAFDDILVGNGVANVLEGRGGMDTILGFQGDDTLYGGDGDDDLYGMQGNDTLDGGDGNDLLIGGSGNDYINGGSGFNVASHFQVQNDTVSSGVTVDLRLQGVAQNTGQGSDTLVNIQGLSGTQFNDILIGDDNVNWLISAGLGTNAPGGDDQLYGNGGDDLFSLGTGNVLADGGSGNDTVGFGGAGATLTHGLTISLALQGVAQATSFGNITLIGIENLSGSGEDDVLIGDDNDNLLAGAGESDVLIGGAGNDRLYGDGIYTTGISDNVFGPPALVVDATTLSGQDPGNDLLEGGLGDDYLDGGVGIDTATYAHASGSVTVNLNGGFANGADGNDTLVNIENVIGSEFNDNVTGNSGNNVLYGLGGNDTLQGHAGDDIIYGGDGNDTINGDLGELNTTVSGNDTIYGGNGNDVMRGGLGNDAMYGGANNDLMRGGGGVDYFDGGDDDGEGFNGIGDRVSFFEQLATQGAIADLRTGVISNDGFGNVETMVGIESLGGDTAYVDTFYGNDGRNYLTGSRGDFIYGFGGDDALQMAAAAAVMDGGAGIDRLILISSGGWLTPDSNGDGVAESVAAATVGWTVNLTTGTALDGYGNSGTVAGIENIDGGHLGDTLIGDGNANSFRGFDGDDTLNGRGGNDTLDGGNGNDTASYANADGSVSVDLGLGTASGADGNDILISIENAIGSAFDDTLTGDGLANLLSGLAGNDVLRGFGGNDTLNGGAGSDILIGGAGDDTIDGGADRDRVGYYHTNAAAGGVTVSLAITGAQFVGGDQGIDTIINVESVSGTPFADNLTGDSGDNWLWGSAATISPGNVSALNNDRLDGGAGNDLLTVGIGNHTLIGGTGIDTVRFTENGGAVETALTVTLMTVGRAQNTGNGSWTLTGIENLSGGTANDKLTGDDNNNVIAGDLGDDNLIGNAGNDVLIGDGYINVDANGVITTYYDGLSSGGNDTLNGGRGDDFLFGGRGNDTMVGGQGVDRFVIQANSGNDRIVDFSIGVDKVVFDVGSGPTSFGDLTLTKSGSNVLVTWGNSNSLLIEGVKIADLTASNFEFGHPGMTAMTASAEAPSLKTASFGLVDNFSDYGLGHHAMFVDHFLIV